MDDNTISVSLIINAPVERVWPLVIEKQEIDGLQLKERMHVQADPKGSPIAGQVIHTQSAFLHIKMCIDRVVPADSPMTGQTVYARISFLGKEGEATNRWFRDAEHHHVHSQEELKHPWFSLSNNEDIRCIAIDTTSCIILYVGQSEMTTRLLPRWLTRSIDNDESTKRATVKAIETSLKRIKVEAERHESTTDE